MAAAKCRNRRRELTDTLQAVSAAREAAGGYPAGGRVASCVWGGYFSRG